MKKYLLTLVAAGAATTMMAAGWPANYGGVMLQGFYWDSYSDTRWATLTTNADLYSEYFDLIWVPNSGNCQSSTSMGYTPIYWFDQTSSFGTESTLRTMINTYKEKGVGIIEDVVINHKSGVSSWCDLPNETYNGQSVSWTLADICCDDEAASNGYSPSGAYDTGDTFDGSRDLDHTRSNVQSNVKIYLDYLLNDLGYVGFRYDMAKGYSSSYTKLYNQSAQPTYSVGEYWDGDYTNVTNWIKGTGYESAAFDFPLKYVINDAFGNENWSALSNKGIAGDSNMSRYDVTFIDNHDTYNNSDRLVNNVLSANAFILALPGTPCIILPHFQAYQSEIGHMIKARKAAGITNQSIITQQETQGGGYVMKVQGTNGTVLYIAGYVENADTQGFTLIETGTNFAYFVSDGITVDDEGSTAHDINIYVNATTAPYLYAWNGSGTLSSAWPGDQLSNTTTTDDGTSWYYTTYNTASLNIVLNNGSGDQTVDITGITSDVYIEYDGTTGYTIVTGYYSDDTSSLPDCATWVDDYLFCYFEGDSEYTSPNAWAWNTYNNFTGGSWPGTQLTEVGTSSTGNSVYLWKGAVLDESNMPASIIFSTGSGSPQTDTFTFVNGGYYNASGLQGKLTQPEETTITGDVNGDGIVDITDVNEIINIILANGSSDVADINNDNSIDVSDVNALINIILGE